MPMSYASMQRATQHGPEREDSGKFGHHGARAGRPPVARDALT